MIFYSFKMSYSVIDSFFFKTFEFELGLTHYSKHILNTIKFKRITLLLSWELKNFHCTKRCYVGMVNTHENTRFLYF